jgi:hypothetical protein
MSAARPISPARLPMSIACLASVNSSTSCRRLEERTHAEPYVPRNPTFHADVIALDASLLQTNKVEFRLTRSLAAAACGRGGGEGEGGVETSLR